MWDEMFGVEVEFGGRDCGEIGWGEIRFDDLDEFFMLCLIWVFWYWSCVCV